MAIQTWVIEVLNTDEPGVADVAWDSYNLGVVEEGRFRVVYTAFDEKDIEKAKAALELFEQLGEPAAADVRTAMEWYATFRTGMIAMPKPPARKPAAKKAPAKKAKPAAKKPARKS